MQLRCAGQVGARCVGQGQWTGKGQWGRDVGQGRGDRKVGQNETGAVSAAGAVGRAVG